MILAVACAAGFILADATETPAFFLQNLVVNNVVYNVAFRVNPITGRKLFPTEPDGVIRYENIDLNRAINNALFRTFRGGRPYDIYQNNDGQLPPKPYGTYWEFRVNIKEDPERIVVDRSTGEIYYTPDHYANWIKVRGPGGWPPPEQGGPPPWIVPRADLWNRPDLWLLPIGEIAVLTGGLSQKKHDGYGVPTGLQAFPPSTPSTHVLSSQTPVPTSFNVNGTKSFTAGGSFGYNRQLGNLLVGIEGDAAWKKFDASNSATITSNATYGPVFTCPLSTFCGVNNTFFPIIFGGSTIFPAQRTEFFSGQVGQNWDASVRARLGTFVTPSIMTYATGGVAFGNVNGSFSYSGTMSLCNSFFPPPTCTASFPISVTQTTTGADSWSETRVGWTAGAGVETSVGWGWKFRLEYRYTDLGTVSRNVPLTRTCSTLGNSPAACGLPGPAQPSGFVVIPNTGPAFVPISQQAAFQTLRFGIVYSFNGFDVGANLGGSWD
jgi:outer membrane immunogenic protein